MSTASQRYPNSTFLLSFCLLLLLPQALWTSPAFAFRVTVSNDPSTPAPPAPPPAVFARWAVGASPVSVYVNPSGSGFESDSSEVAAAIQLAMDSWSEVTTSSFDFADDVVFTDYHDVFIEGAVLIFWSTDLPRYFHDNAAIPGATVYLFSENGSGEIVAAAIALNAKTFAWSTNEPRRRLLGLVCPLPFINPCAVDLESVALHELGHAAGLSHSEIGSAVMRTPTPAYNHTLARDDERGLTFLYPTDGYPQVTSFVATPSPVLPSTDAVFSIEASDPEQRRVSYNKWQVTGGRLFATSKKNEKRWEAPPETGAYTVSVDVSDGRRNHIPLRYALALSVGQPTITTTSSTTSTTSTSTTSTTLPPSCPTADWEAVRDFSINENPICAWSYGSAPVAAPPGGGAFAPYPNHTADASGHPGWDEWHVSADPQYAPLVAHNSSGTSISVSSVIFPPDLLLMHPAGDTIVRWTTPAAGSYQVSGRFESVDTVGATVRAIVAGPSGPIFDEQVRGYAIAHPFDFTVTLNQGDVLDFRVNQDTVCVPNCGDEFAHDSVGFAAQIVRQ